MLVAGRGVRNFELRPPGAGGSLGSARAGAPWALLLRKARLRRVANHRMKE